MFQVQPKFCFGPTCPGASGFSFQAHLPASRTGWNKNVESEEELHPSPASSKANQRKTTKSRGAPDRNQLLAGSSPHDIYNMDETGLNYRALPTRTLGSQVDYEFQLGDERHGQNCMAAARQQFNS